MTPAMVLEVLGICSPGIFALGWIVGRDWDAGVFHASAKLPTAKALKRSAIPFDGKLLNRTEKR